MFGLGAGEILLIGVFALIFIGPKKLPELARGLGQSLREFQKAKDEFMDEVKDDTQLPPKDNEKIAENTLPTGVNVENNDEVNKEKEEENASKSKDS